LATRKRHFTKKCRKQKSHLIRRELKKTCRKPIKTEEFIVELAALVPIFAEQEDAFTQWFEKTPIGMASFL
jgi:hypothetical protein